MCIIVHACNKFVSVWNDLSDDAEVVMNHLSLKHYHH